MTGRVPYYERDLASFADDIITRQARRSDGGWHAVLDCGIVSQVSDPDFSTHGYGSTRDEAASRCAHAIRQDALGIGKYAPHSVLKPGYDLSFRLMKHWDKKERFRSLGIDPNEMVRLARGLNQDLWKLQGEWLSTWQCTKAFEFGFQLCLAEMTHAVTSGEVDASEAKAKVLDGARKAFDDVRWRASASEETWSILEERVDAHLATLDIDSPQRAM
jgi:hypothetical protein